MSDPHQLLPAYALDALDGAERDSFEEHLRTCEDCRLELADFGPTVAALSALSETAPPPELRRDVLSAISRVRQDDPLAAEEANGRIDEPGAAAGAVAGTDQPRRAVTDPTAEGRHPVIALNGRARRRGLARTAGAIIAAAAMVAAVALGGWALGRQQLGAQQRADGEAISRVLSASDARTHQVTAPNGMLVTYIVSAGRNSALAVVENVPDPGAGRTYQLWTVRSRGGQSAFVPDRTFATPAPDGPIILVGDVASAAALGITIEPDGGSPQPTTEPFAVQSL